MLVLECEAVTLLSEHFRTHEGNAVSETTSQPTEPQEMAASRVVAGDVEQRAADPGHDTARADLMTEIRPSTTRKWLCRASKGALTGGFPSCLPAAIAQR